MDFMSKMCNMLGKFLEPTSWEPISLEPTSLEPTSTVNNSSEKGMRTAKNNLKAVDTYEAATLPGIRKTVQDYSQSDEIKGLTEMNDGLLALGLDPRYNSGLVDGPNERPRAVVKKEAQLKEELLKEEIDTIKRGFKIIIKSPETTPAEKALAEFGNNIVNTGPFTSFDSLFLAKRLMGIMTGPIKESLESVIARTAIDLSKRPLSEYVYEHNGTTDQVKYQPGKVILTEALKTLAKNPSISEQKRAVAKLGLDFERNIDFGSLQHKVDGMTGVLEYIEKEDANAKSIGSAIAAATLMALPPLCGFFTNNLELPYIRRFLRVGFDNILYSSSTTDQQKALAEDGININTNYDADNYVTDSANTNKIKQRGAELEQNIMRQIEGNF